MTLFGDDRQIDHHATGELAAHVASEQDFPRGVKHLVAQRLGTSAVVRTG